MSLVRWKLLSEQLESWRHFEVSRSWSGSSRHVNKSD